MVIKQYNHTTPLISVVMTSYNCELYIEEAIQSILTQTLKEFEFIIVDDGSTDHTKELIAAIIDPRIRFYILEHNGRAYALNYAVRKAQCSYIAFMDADDKAMHARLEKQYQLFQQNSSIDIVSSWYELIDRKGKQLNIIRKVPEHHDKIEYEMTIHSSVCFPATMMRRDLIIQVGGFNTLLHSAVDYDLFLRLLPISTLYNIQEILLQYRIQPFSISVSRNTEQHLNTLKLSNNYLNYCLQRTHSIHEKRAIYFRFGLNEYYHGSMRSARRWFVNALPDRWTQWLMWRYLLATYIGDKMFQLLRKRFRRYAAEDKYEKSFNV